ncbi:tetratricopeptide repeat protein [Pantoea sp. BAV 3049]|uniref:tetratricopeptide repeat protein n=1 Tax=Pantoea sp. BAV 3049 TaxID=2654188 RepID=UPI00131E918B|nr:tetratricopeptide repeat protein [Pantoea sp. BAV 3049]
MFRMPLSAALMLCSVTAFADASSPNPECANIKNYAAAGDKAYKAKQYDKARESYTQQVGWSESCQLSESAIATAYNNVALTWVRQGQYLKAKAWLMINEKDAKSQYNLGLIKDKLTALPQPTGPAGEYWLYAGKGMWNSYEVKAVKEEKYKVAFDGVYAGGNAMMYGPNIGGLEGGVAIKDNQGTYQQPDIGNEPGCAVSMNFTPASLQTSVKGDCGFGFNVRAEGDYVRVK